MKRSNALYKNPFPEETRAIFQWNNRCWRCGRTDRGLQADHITGRKYEFQASKFNLAPLCITCHANKNSKWIPELLKKTRLFLEVEGYNPDETDFEFFTYLDKSKYIKNVSNRT